MIKIYVIPLKNGCWRVAKMTESRHDRWDAAYHRWWEKKGCRLAISPEMWVES